MLGEASERRFLAHLRSLHHGVAQKADTQDTLRFRAVAFHIAQSERVHANVRAMLACPDANGTGSGIEAELFVGLPKDRLYHWQNPPERRPFDQTQTGIEQHKREQATRNERGCG